MVSSTAPAPAPAARTAAMERRLRLRRQEARLRLRLAADAALLSAHHACEVPRPHAPASSDRWARGADVAGLRLEIGELRLQLLACQALVSALQLSLQQQQSPVVEVAAVVEVVMAEVEERPSTATVTRCVLPSLEVLSGVVVKVGDGCVHVRPTGCVPTEVVALLRGYYPGSVREEDSESLPRGLFAVRQLLVRVDLHDIAEEDLVFALGTAVRFMCYTDHNGVGGYAVTSSSAS